jgi:hypothetical protein
MSWGNRERTGRPAKVPGLRWAGQHPAGTCASFTSRTPEPDSVFVITAYDLTGKPLAAYRRRRKKKRQ